LDMRMDRGKKETAFHLVNLLPEEELKSILKRYGEERWAARISRGIVRRRGLRPIKTTGELSSVVLSSIPRRYRSNKIHPATRTFQALRIFLNDELRNLEEAVKEGIDLLTVGGRFCIISYHSLEDRIVKNFFKTMSQGCICPPSLPQCVCSVTPKLKILTRKPLRPGIDEVRFNPRSRSAKLRIVERQ
ncbi:MAG: 16S rRNA (cytosine(1402)-N(4))-methyltransferase RsmH, partial [Thermodesulfobacteriota bacterium]